MREIYQYDIENYIYNFLKKQYRSELLVKFITCLLQIKSREFYKNQIYEYNATFSGNTATLDIPISSEIDTLSLVIIDNGAIYLDNIITINYVDQEITLNNNYTGSGTVKIINLNYFMKTYYESKITGQRVILENYLRSKFNTYKINIKIITIDSVITYFHKKIEQKPNYI